MKRWRNLMVVCAVFSLAVTVPVVASVEDISLRPGLEGSSAENPPPSLYPAQAVPSPLPTQWSSSRIRSMWPHLAVLLLSVAILLFCLKRGLRAKRRKRRRRKRSAR